MSGQLNPFSFGRLQRVGVFLTIIFAVALFTACVKKPVARGAFYYWKSMFSLSAQQKAILKKSGGNSLYVRFFDVKWNEKQEKAFPEAIVNFDQGINGLTITPVIFITNKTFENIAAGAVDSLSLHCDQLISRIAGKAHITYSTIQVDCDWTLGTRDKYFAFLRNLKRVGHHRLEATIRLHQVKYKEQTGIPPVDRGILMFYNMGALNANPQQGNSIYNEADAQRYVTYVSQYPLALDVALPLFSWSIGVRNGAVTAIYANLGDRQLSDTSSFEFIGQLYRCKKSMFLNGIYIKENDTFKLEATSFNTLKIAAKQLSAYLPPLKNRTIIYYELANINLSKFKAESLKEVSADF
jgi:hypothetical protein